MSRGSWRQPIFQGYATIFGWDAGKAPGFPPIVFRHTRFPAYCVLSSVLCARVLTINHYKTLLSFLYLFKFLSEAKLHMLLAFADPVVLAASFKSVF